jgi:signal transduction histidine kinase
VRWIGTPLDLLIEKVRRVGVGDRSGPLDLRGRSELSELARAVNVMCEDLAAAEENMRAETEARIEAVNQLRHADRLRTVGGLASGMAHELGTPLNVISARAGMIASGQVEGEDAKQSAGIVRTQAERMTTLIRQLLDFARPSTPHRVRTDIRTLLKDTVEFVAPLKYSGVVRMDAGEGGDAVRARIDPSQMQQVLANLVVNALQAMPDGGEVRLGAVNVVAAPPTDPEAPKRACVKITVKDEGLGMAEGDLPHVFEPFFTTKGVGEGTGLGLSIAHGIVREHGGWIEVRSTKGEGSEFSVYLPSGGEA